MAINPDKLYYEYINYIYKECPEIVDYPFISLLKRSGFIKETKKTKKEFKRLSRYFLNRSDAENYVYTCTDIVKDERLDSYIEKGVNVELSHQSVDGLYAEKISQKNITKEDWLPKDRIYHEEEFFDWINSINSGFQNRLYYKKFDLYCQQCYNWLTENKSLADFDELDDARDYMFQEFDRCYDNTMYFAIKYAYLKDGDVEGGRRKYTITEGYEHHKILLYLYDCGYSLMLGKPRQIGSTSILGIAAIKEVLLNSNFYLKFVTEDETTGKEIFEDKIKFTYSELPDWWKTKISNFSGTLFKLGKNKEKGEISEVNSKIEVLAPKRTAINGGSPQLVYLDEIGSIGMLSEMIREGRPTMFYVDPKTGKLTMKRRLISWGCVCAGTKVWNNKGELVNIEDLNPVDGIIGYDGSGASKEEITYWQPPAEKPCYRITLTGNRTLECSEDHPILSAKTGDYKTIRKSGKKYYEKNIKFTETKDLEIGSQVALLDEIPFFGDKEMEDPRFIGYMIGDGNYGTTETTKRRQPRFYNCDKDINDYISSKYDTTVFNEYITKDGRLYQERNIRGVSKMLREVGIYGQSKDKKRLPKDFHKYTEHTICEVLGGIFDTDGCVHNYGTKIDIDSISKDMLEDIRYALQKLGIYSSIHNIKARIAEHRKDKNDYFRLEIAEKQSIVRFYQKIKLTVKYKQERLKELYELCKNSKSRSRSKNHKGIYFNKIKNIEYIGYKPVYNLTAGNTNTYIANGIVTHNTGTSATKGRGAYEKEWNSLMSLWLQKKFEAGIVPLFFDWTTRLKTQEEYDKEKEYYYGGGYGSNEGMDIETSKVQFHQHYPSSPSDMFQTTAKTVIPTNYIYDAYARIRQAAQIDKSEYGYFTPIYDSTGEKVVGSDWNICERDDPLCSTQIFRHPDPAYKNRYYMGTDPVAANTGHSKMSSTIYDDLFGIPSALLNHRVQGDHRESFMQCLLLGMYYSPTEEIPELVERNIGQNYIDFVEKHGKYDRLVCNSQLPEYLQSGSGAIIGIDNKGKRTEYIIANMREGFTETHHKIYILTYFEQLKTFVCKMRSNGNETWETIDKKIYFDDALFSFVFAYLCKKCYYDRYPVNIEKEGENSVKSIKYAYQHDKDYNLIIKPKLETQRKHG